MKGRIAVVEFMPALNLLVKKQVVSTQTMQVLLKKYLASKTLNTQDVIQDLYQLDIPEDKYEVFSYVIETINNTNKEESQQCTN